MKKLNYYFSALFMLCSICVLVFAKDSIQTDKKSKEDNNIESLPLNFDSLEDLFNRLTETTWQIYTLSNDSLQKEKLAQQKKILLQSFIKSISNPKQPIGFNIDKNKQIEIETLINDSKIENNAFVMLNGEIAKNNLLIESNLAKLFKNLRKQVDFFLQQQKIIDIIHPTLNILNAMPTNFEIPKDITAKQHETLQLQIEKYRNTLVTAIQLVSYFEWHVNEFIPQNTILLHTSIRWTLQIIGHFISVNHDNLNIIKAVLSILCFVILWVCRKIITNIIVYVMDIAVHLTNHDKELHSVIQTNLLKPVSLFLLVWSLQVCVGVLYYPQLQPSSLEICFSILYIINITWFIVALTKSYGTILLTKILQRTNNEFRKEIINLILKTLYSVIIIIACLWILKYLGFNISTIIASLGLGGLAVALAIKDILANFFASVMLLFDNSFSQGDWIECGSVDGVVVEIGLRRTTIRTSDNALLFVPNSELSGKVIRNWSRRKSGRRVKMSIGIKYNTNETQLKQCVATIKQMLLEHPEISITPNYSEEEKHIVTLRKDIISLDDFLGYKSGISVCVETLGSSINILVDCFTKSISKKDFFEVREDIIFKIMAIVQECNLDLA